MKAAIRTLGEVLYSPSQYVIPVFQRNYRWERPQWDKLWASLIEIQKSDKIGNHFMGFLVFVQGGVAQPGQHIRFHLIDGQQRLTTTSLLLAALRNVAQRLQQTDLATEIHDDYLVHQRKKGEHHYRLLPKAQDHDAYVAIAERKSAPAGRMSDAMVYFEGELDRIAAREPEGLRSVFDAVCQRLEFMCATLESENAYSIFKSLNSTGVPLGQSDLIRNFVFMHVHPDEQDDFDREDWSPLEDVFRGDAGRLDEEKFSRFFRDMLMSAGQYVQPNDTFATFESRNEATGFKPKALAGRLEVLASHHAAISGTTSDASPEVTVSLAALNQLESSTTYPLLLALFIARDEGRLNSKQLAHCIDMLKGFIFRRFVSRESSRGYGAMFVRAIESTLTDPVSGLQKFLLQRGWPHDSLFVESFESFPLYKRGYARQVLETLELASGHKEQGDLKQAEIEHIMPQTLSDAWRGVLGEDSERVHAEWLHRPGNLTLSAYNQEMGNQPFAVKRARFEQSNIGLTREVAKRSSWSEKEISDRGRLMANLAAELWPGPKEPAVAETVGLREEQTYITRLAFWKGLAAHLAFRHPELPSIEPGKQRRIPLVCAVPHLRLDARYKLQEGTVALVMRFKPKLLKLWLRLRDDPQQINSIAGETWTFEQPSVDADAFMVLERGGASMDGTNWQSLYGWLGQKLDHVYSLLLPYLNAEVIELLPSVHSPGTDQSEREVLTSIKLQQRRFWGELAKAVEARSKELRPQKPLPQHWTEYRIGRSGISLNPMVNTRDDRISVEVALASTSAKEHFRLLLAQREAIEADLGFALDWQELPTRIMSRITSFRPESRLQDEARWPEYVEWMTDRLLAMERVFRPLIKALP